MRHERNHEAEPSLMHILQADEELYVQARAIGAVIGVTAASSSTSSESTRRHS